MNKNDLVAAVARGTGLSKSDSANAVDSMLDSIVGALKGGNEVRLVGFGTFSVAHRQASEGRNPRTGERIEIPASRQPKFKASSTLLGGHGKGGGRGTSSGGHGTGGGRGTSSGGHGRGGGRGR